jgi:hypothetical protein
MNQNETLIVSEREHQSIAVAIKIVLAFAGVVTVTWCGVMAISTYSLAKRLW